MLPLLFELMGSPPFESTLYSIWPCPFLGFNASDKNLQKQGNLMLVDFSEVGQENAIVTRIQPTRNVYFIIVSYNGGSELSSGWMNGTNLISTATWAKGNELSVLKIPDVNTMLNVSPAVKFTTFFTFFGMSRESSDCVYFIDEN